MRCTSRCDDCVVTYFVRRDDGAHDGLHDGAAEPLSLDRGEEQVVRLLSKAGLIPELRHRLVG